MILGMAKSVIKKAVVLAEEKSSNNFLIYKKRWQNPQWKKRWIFFICEILVLNFARHIARNHLSEVDVQKILSNAPDRKKENGYWIF